MYLNARLLGMLRCTGTDASISNAIEGLTKILDELHRMFGTTTPEQLVKIAQATVDERNSMKETIESLSRTVGVLRTSEVDKDVHPQDPNKPLSKGPEQEHAEKAAQLQATRRAQIGALPGRNDTERAMTLLSRERPGFGVLDRLDQVRIASAFLNGQDEAGPVHATQGTPSSSGGRLALLASYPGRNDTERAIALLSSERAGFKAQDWLSQVMDASAWLRGE